MDDNESGRAVTGGAVFGALAVLTALEYVIGVKVVPSLPFIVPIVAVMAGLILVYLMRLPDVWRKEDE